MRAKTLLTTVLIFTFSVGTLVAEPKSKDECCTPTPVGGMEALTANTIYPVLAERQKVESDVVVNFQVDENGAVSELSILSSGGKFFDQSAMEAIVNTQWEPAMQNGEPVSVVYSQEFNFRIN